jgi:hypothetical protein
MVNCQRNREVIDIGQMLDDLLLVVGPEVDAVGEVRSVFIATVTAALTLFRTTPLLIPKTQ